jgi:nicotinamidase-related amidase
MSSFRIEVRYSRELSDPEVPCREEHFGHGKMTWDLATEQTGLVLVDCWDQHPVETHLERGGQIARDRILPVMTACREAGIAVIHAPSPPQARLYPQWTKYADERDLSGARGPAPDWPPRELRHRTGAYAALARPMERRREQWMKQVLPERRIMDFLGPEPEDFVVATGNQLHRLCRHREIVHLFYAGFAANICVQRRDYGVWAMLDRGYNIVLLRDCTTAIEHSETWDGMWLTHCSILDMELRASSTTSDAFLGALRG